MLWDVYMAYTVVNCSSKMDGDNVTALTQKLTINKRRPLCTVTD